MSGFGLKLDVSRMLARIRLLRARWTGDGLRKLGDFAAAEVLKDSLQSFSRQADPTTGKPWTPRKRPNPRHLHGAVSQQFANARPAARTAGEGWT